MDSAISLEPPTPYLSPAAGRRSVFKVDDGPPRDPAALGAQVLASEAIEISPEKDESRAPSGSPAIEIHPLKAEGSRSRAPSASESEAAGSVQSSSRSVSPSEVGVGLEPAAPFPASGPRDKFSDPAALSRPNPLSPPGRRPDPATKSDPATPTPRHRLLQRPIVPPVVSIPCMAVDYESPTPHSSARHPRRPSARPYSISDSRGPPSRSPRHSVDWLHPLPGAARAGPYSPQGPRLRPPPLAEGLAPDSRSTSPSRARSGAATPSSPGPGGRWLATPSPGPRPARPYSDAAAPAPATDYYLSDTESSVLSLPSLPKTPPWARPRWAQLGADGDESDPGLPRDHGSPRSGSMLQYSDSESDLASFASGLEYAEATGPPAPQAHSDHEPLSARSMATSMPRSVMHLDFLPPDPLNDASWLAPPGVSREASFAFTSPSVSFVYTHTPTRSRSRTPPRNVHVPPLSMLQSDPLFCSPESRGRPPRNRSAGADRNVIRNVVTSNGIRSPRDKLTSLRLPPRTDGE